MSFLYLRIAEESPIAIGPERVANRHTETKTKSCRDHTLHPFEKTRTVFQSENTRTIFESWNTRSYLRPSYLVG